MSKKGCSLNTNTKKITSMNFRPKTNLARFHILIYTLLGRKLLEGFGHIKHPFVRECVIRKHHTLGPVFIIHRDTSRPASMLVHGINDFYRCGGSS